MVKKEIVIIADYSKSTSLTLDELCEICHLSPDFINDLMEYEIIHPETTTHSQQFIFELNQLERIKTALRLQHDLEVNFEGISLILNLLEELKELRAKQEIIEKHLLHKE